MSRWFLSENVIARRAQDQEIQNHTGIEHRQHPGKQIAAGRRAVMNEQDAVDADPGGPQFRHRPGLPFADLRNAVAPFKIEVDVPILVQNAYRQRQQRMPSCRLIQ